MHETKDGVGWVFINWRVMNIDTSIKIDNEDQCQQLIINASDM